MTQDRHRGEAGDGPVRPSTYSRSFVGKVTNERTGNRVNPSHKFAPWNINFTNCRASVCAFIRIGRRWTREVLRRIVEMSRRSLGTEGFLKSQCTTELAVNFEHVLRLLRYRRPAIGTLSPKLSHLHPFPASRGLHRRKVPFARAKRAWRSTWRRSSRSAESAPSSLRLLL